MYTGNMTPELKKLYSEYENHFGYSPDGEESLEYGEADYKDYVSDIKKSIKLNVHIADLYPDNDDEF